ncbi:MAG: response regulator [Geobacteraceae bacterium]|nr:response regulator [Geobacteraceae bacterium]NTW80474.1 response regulator [Geobacteraceae bacterium]
MSLAGKLEELGLGEILQIVSLSRKTGVLSLSSKGRDGSVFFRNGQVVRAVSSAYQQSLGDVLIQKGVIDLAMLRKSLAFQQEHGFCERLGIILVKNFGISQEVIEVVVREQIENVVYSLFSWTEGTFTFEVQTSIEIVDGIKMDPLQFILDHGLNPQFLAMEGTRISEEQRNVSETGVTADDFSEDEEDFSFDLVDGSNAPSLVPHSVQQPIVIVDDDGPTLRNIADGLTEKGFVVHAMTRSEDTLIKVDSLHRSGERPAVLIDLIMPKMDGSGVLGGVELLELLHNNFKDLQLIIMTDYHHAEAEKKISELGYSFIIKPRRVEINNNVIMDSFLTQVTHVIRHSSGAKITGEWQDRFNLGDELRIEMGEDDDMPRAEETNQQSGAFSLLRGMLEELNNPELQGGVLLLVLRFASEFMNRAIVFTINDQIISGFGQFGITDSTISGDERVRAIHFPQESGSMFDEPLRTCQPHKFSPNPTPVDSYLFEQLGGGVPAEVFIGPLISQSKVIGFLYGDNLPNKKPIGDVEALVIFLAQAGVSMEKSLLQRQLDERTTS